MLPMPPLFRSVSAKIEVEIFSTVLADVNKDGKVNVKDATAIQKYCAHFDTGYDIGIPFEE